MHSNKMLSVHTEIEFYDMKYSFVFVSSTRLFFKILFSFQVTQKQWSIFGPQARVVEQVLIMLNLTNTAFVFCGALEFMLVDLKPVSLSHLKVLLTLSLLSFSYFPS